MHKREKQRKAYGYVRCSHIDQANEGDTLAVQREQIELICRLNAWELVASLHRRRSVRVACPSVTGQKAGAYSTSLRPAV